MVSPRDQILFIIFLLPLNSVLGKPEEYHADGSNVTLQTMKHGGNKLTSIDWKHDENIAVTWDEQKLKAYRNFEDRIFLNLTNGDLTLIGVTESESGQYTVALNGKDCDTELKIKVIHYVPVPTVTVNCSIEDDLRLCLYTCAGNTSQSKPVSYEWSSLNPAPLSASNKTKVTKESLTGPRNQWFCTMKNPVSKATATVTSPPRSTPHTSPLAELGGYSFSTVIFAGIFALIGVHRHITGVWIWKKETLEKRKDERNGSSKFGTKYGSPKPLLNQTEDNLELIEIKKP